MSLISLSACSDRKRLPEGYGDAQRSSMDRHDRDPISGLFDTLISGERRTHTCNRHPAHAASEKNRADLGCYAHLRVHICGDDAHRERFSVFRSSCDLYIRVRVAKSVAECAPPDARPAAGTSRAFAENTCKSELTAQHPGNTSTPHRNSGHGGSRSECRCMGHDALLRDK